MQTKQGERVAILGASNKTERYAYLALGQLQASGYQVIPVNPKLEEIEGTPVIANLHEIKEPIHTLTVYLNPTLSTPLLAPIIALRPQRVISNPGAENPYLEKALEKQGIQCIQACTLVLLRTNQF